MSPIYNVGCPKCSARPGDRCVTLTTGRTTDTHVECIRRAWGVA